MNRYLWVKQKPSPIGRDQSCPKIEAFLGLYAIAIMALFFSLTSSKKKKKKETCKRGNSGMIAIALDLKFFISIE